MLTLALDTTAEFGSIALAQDGDILEEVVLHEPQGFSGALFPRIEELLGRQQIALGDIDIFAAASGPGSFTGVRVGLAAIKGLAEVLGKRAAAVSNLQALATFGSAPARATVIDARRGEIFGALFDAGGDAIISESVISFPRFLTMLQGHDFEWISADFSPFISALTGSPFEHFPVVQAPRALAGAIARMAPEMLTDPLTIEANYVRRSDAELLWKTF